MRSNTNQEPDTGLGERKAEVCYLLREVGMSYQIVAWPHHQMHITDTNNKSRRVTSGAG